MAITTNLTNLVASLIILLLGLVLGRFLGKLIQRILNELELNRILRKEGIKLPLEEFIGSLVKYTVYVIALILALSQIGLTEIVLNILIIILLVLIIFFIILAMKDFVPNFSAGLYIHQKSMFKAGDKIKIRNTEGTVIRIGLVETKIITKGNDTIYIPNSLIIKNELIRRK